MFRVQESFSSDTDAAAGAAAGAAATAAASVSEEKDSWTLNIINVLVFGKLSFAPGVVSRITCYSVTIRPILLTAKVCLAG